MNEFECYLFDLQGFLVVEDALMPEQITAINERLDKQIGEVNEPEKPFLRFNRLLPWGSPFQDLIDNPRITPYLLALLGAKFRLDHDYVHIIRHGAGPNGSIMHNGGNPFDPCQYYMYKDGRMYNGLCAVAYNLTDVHPSEGGFGCIPGSHKSNLSLPNEWMDLENPPHCVQEITGKAGAAIIFTEALTHGTMPWKGQRDRRTLFYKYSPYPSAWLRNYYNPDDYLDLSEAQRSILRNPGFYPY